MLNIYDVKLRPVPLNRHQKMLELRHGPIRFIYIRLRHDDPDTSPAVPAVRAVRISNDLYGSDIRSACEADKGHSCPIDSDISPGLVDKELLKAHIHIIAHCKLTRIIRSPSLKENDIRIGDLVQVFIKRGHQKRRRWLSPRKVIILTKNQEFCQFRS